VYFLLKVLNMHITSVLAVLLIGFFIDVREAKTAIFKITFP
jgi:hypothetical protein